MGSVNRLLSKQNALECPPFEEKFKCPKCKEVTGNAHQTEIEINYQLDNLNEKETDIPSERNNRQQGSVHSNTPVLLSGPQTVSNMSSRFSSSSSNQPLQSNQPQENPSEQTTEILQTELFDYKIFENIEYPFFQDHSKYEYFEKIKQGNFGEVFKAKCKKTNKIVAIKTFLRENEPEGRSFVNGELVKLTKL
ncbi:unnamed protein product [Brachionus calyciflorus]|uniref:Protein kinase domain-containing protein n=1 Tax=Brachionus calyciflorus TaxID=104777 RepID=A0A814IV33_9BILA|nr:unnamed protein product [Brachionus calyciflorus]